MGARLTISGTEIEAQLEGKLEDIANYILTRSQEIIVQNKSVYTGNLLQSIKIEHLSKTAYRINYYAPYAHDIEYGTEPHYIPPEELYDWVGKKLNIKDKDVRGKVSYLIARKIAKEGTEAKPFVRPAIHEAIAKWGRK